MRVLFLSLCLAAMRAAAEEHPAVWMAMTPEGEEQALPLGAFGGSMRGGAPILGHYGKPPGGCEADEQAFQISGVPGMVCSPTCDASGGCPTDVPDGVTARPQCALQNAATGDKYCVLICHEGEEEAPPGLRATPLRDAQCGEGTCQIVQAGLGICTYDQAAVETA